MRLSRLGRALPFNQFALKRLHCSAFSIKGGAATAKITNLNNSCHNGRVKRILSSSTADSVDKKEHARRAELLANLELHVASNLLQSKNLMLKDMKKSDIGGLAYKISTQHETQNRAMALQLSPEAVNGLEQLLDAMHEKREHLRDLISNTKNKIPPKPSDRDLMLVGVRNGLVFVGFGFMDNFIMVIAGDVIDFHLGVGLGLSTMAAAGLGNTMSDVAGYGLGGIIESFSNKLGIPEPDISVEQYEHHRTAISRARHIGNTIGLTLGCLVGMFPLLFMGLPVTTNHV